MSRLHVLAPMSGWSASLDEAPDAVFSQRLLGDGVMLDPTTDTPCAPCDGEVLSVAPRSHAVAIRADNGAEILLHVGIDTVELKGSGFRVLTTPGRRVRAGEPLIALDLDLIATHAKSLATPIVVTNGERFTIATLAVDRAVTLGEPLFEVVPLATAEAGHAPAAGEAHERVTVLHANGIHARPAGLIAQCAKGFRADVFVQSGGRSANAKSPVALMSLGVRVGEEVTLAATGDDALPAIAAIRQVIVSLADVASPPEREARTQATPVTPTSPAGDRRLRGVIASRGLAVGRAVTLRRVEIAVDETGQGVAHESAELERARSEVRTRLEALAARSSKTARDVIAAHLEFLDDWELLAAARRAITQGKSAGYAWRRAVRDSADTLHALADPRMVERVDDLLDLESQVLTALTGTAPAMLDSLPDRAILIAEDLKPSQFVSLDATRLAGICMAGGGPTSHVAILAAAVGIPALVAMGPSVLSVRDAVPLILDADQGVLDVAPDAEATAAAERALEVRHERRQAQRAQAQSEARTADGTHIEVFANLGSLAEARVAVAQGADGCGLLRTEFLFLDREAAPSEDEQQREYQAIASALVGRPLVVRTLDIGGDKPIAYLPLPEEENPALGLRGIRTSLWRPNLLRAQLRAILRVQPAEQCQILLPMITDAAEVIAVRRMIAQVIAELGVATPVRVGAMIETPAAALIAQDIAREADFLSIGTNDLTQYTLAMDRGHRELAHRVDALHPAVLRLIARVVESARRYDRPVAVCGGLASEPLAVPILIGLGIRELSVVPASIPLLKALVRAVTLDECRAISERALAASSAEAVRMLANEFAAQRAKVTS